MIAKEAPRLMSFSPDVILAIAGLVFLVVGAIKSVIPGPVVGVKALAVSFITSLLIFGIYVYSQPSLPGRTDAWEVLKAFVAIWLGPNGAYAVFDTIRREALDDRG